MTDTIARGMAGSAYSRLAQGVDVMPGVFNYRQDQLKYWRTRRGRVIAAQGAAVVACIGDSKTWGTGANGAAFVGAKSKAYPRQLAAILTARGLPAFDGSTFGTGRVGMANYLAGDVRVTAGAGWGEFGSDGIAGFFVENKSNTTSFSFAPERAFDQIEIYDTAGSTYAEWTININGGSALATVAPSSPLRLRKTTISCTKGAHTINLQRTGVGTNFILNGIVTRDTTSPAVEIHNLGSYASQASFWNSSSNPWSPLNGIAALDPDLSIIDLGTNEWINSISAATFKSNMSPIITKCKESGDVVLVAPAFSNPVAVPQARQDAIRAACYELATENNCPLVDHGLAIGGYAAALANGMYLTGDDTHLSGAGYADEAVRFANLLLS